MLDEEKQLDAPVVADEEEVIEAKEPEKKVDEEETVEKSHYQEELERIEAEKKALEDRNKADMEARRRQVEAKDKALAEEKEKTKSVKESWKQETLSEMDRRLEIRDARSRAARITNDPTAHKVIMYHYETLPDSLRSKSLDPDVAVEENLQTALALANRRKVASMLSEESMQDQQNRRSAASMGGAGGSSTGSSFQGTPSATTRAASSLLSAYAGNNKDLSKKLTDRLTKR